MAGSNRRILIVEDDALIAMLLEDMLDELSYEIAGKATDLEQALSLAATTEFDAAILDVSLAGKSSVPVANLLDERKKPYIFATGYGSLPDGVSSRSTQVLSKPYRLQQLKEALANLDKTP
jgi:DNA-binding response OmpR family regulator